MGEDLLVEVHAVSLNPIDYKLPKVKGVWLTNNKGVGLDFSGIVLETALISPFKKGDCIFGYSKATFADRILVNPDHCALIPNNISFAEAASLPVCALTSL